MFLLLIMMQDRTFRRYLSTVQLMMTCNDIITIIRKRILSLRARTANTALKTAILGRLRRTLSVLKIQLNR